MDLIYRMNTTPAACPDNMVAGEHYRIDGIPFIPQEFRNFLTIFKHGEV